MKQIIVVGAGDLGRELVWLIEDINRITPKYLILGFVDDDDEKQGRRISGYDVLGKTGLLSNQFYDKDVCAIIAVQDCRARQKIINANAGFNRWESIIHPSSVIAPDVSIGEGTVIFPFVTISVGCKLSEFNLVYTNAMLSNDVECGQFVSIMSNVQISDRVIIGEGTYVSSGCCIYPSVSVGDWAEISVGTVVSKNIRNNERIGKKGDIFRISR